ncbi:MAG: endonuclease domain-containing protein [Oscillospiraceae bacterium]|nr:endonuclease domain-containing protein [Oscillospiraceae bacterium]
MNRHEQLKANARNLRNNATKEENTLWYQYLKKQPVQWYRQMVIGDYIVDFYCRKMHLAIELDGSQHYEEAQMEYDAKRTAFLNDLGIEVLRFTNTDIKYRLGSVCDAIDIKVAELQKEMECSV